MYRINLTGSLALSQNGGHARQVRMGTRMINGKFLRVAKKKETTHAPRVPWKVLGGSSHLVSGLVHPSDFSGLTLLIPLITGVITHLLSGMSHQVGR